MIKLTVTLFSLAILMSSTIYAAHGGGHGGGGAFRGGGEGFRGGEGYRGGAGYYHPGEVNRQVNRDLNRYGYGAYGAGYGWGGYGDAWADGYPYDPYYNSNPDEQQGYNIYQQNVEY